MQRRRCCRALSRRRRSFSNAKHADCGRSGRAARRRGHDLWRLCAYAENSASCPLARGFTSCSRRLMFRVRLRLPATAAEVRVVARDSQSRLEPNGGTGSIVRVMRSRGLRAHRWPIASLALAGSVLGMSCGGAAADTLEWALVQAYQNNPSLNAQRASLRATDENVPQALSGYRPKLTVTANGGYDYASTLSAHGHSVGVSQHRDLHQLRHALCAARRRRDRDADALQRQSDRQQSAPGGKPGHGRARDLARHRAAGAARFRDRLHEFAARRRDPATQPQQRRSAHRAIEADPRPLQCRRGDAHRRGASGIAAGARPLAASQRAVELRDVGRQLSPRHRRRPG